MRVGVALGLIVVGCSAPARVPSPIAPSLLAQPVPTAVVAPPVAAPPEPPLAIAPYLVAALPPLGDKHGLPAHHAPPVPVAAQVTEVLREGEHERVRVRRSDDRMDRNWKAAFADPAGKRLGECKIVAWDAHELECVTTLPLAKLTPAVALEPPTRDEQIKRVMLAQAQGDEILVTFAAGTNDDLGDDWSVELVDDNGVAVPKGGCKIVNVAASLSMCRTHAKVEQLSGVLATRP